MPGTSSIFRLGKTTTPDRSKPGVFFVSMQELENWGKLVMLPVLSDVVEARCLFIGVPSCGNENSSSFLIASNSAINGDEHLLWGKTLGTR